MARLQKKVRAAPQASTPTPRPSWRQNMARVFRNGARIISSSFKGPKSGPFEAELPAQTTHLPPTTLSLTNMNISDFTPSSLLNVVETNTIRATTNRSASATIAHTTAEVPLIIYEKVAADAITPIGSDSALIFCSTPQQTASPAITGVLDEDEALSLLEGMLAPSPEPAPAPAPAPLLSSSSAAASTKHSRDMSGDTAEVDFASSTSSPITKGKGRIFDSSASPTAFDSEIHPSELDSSFETVSLDGEEDEEDSGVLVPGINCVLMSTYLKVMGDERDEHESAVAELESTIEVLQAEVAHRSSKEKALRAQAAQRSGSEKALKSVITSLENELGDLNKEKEAAQLGLKSVLGHLNRDLDTQLGIQAALLKPAEQTFSTFCVTEGHTFEALQEQMETTINLLTNFTGHEIFDVLRKSFHAIKNQMHFLRFMFVGKTYMARQNATMVLKEFDRLVEAQVGTLDELQEEVAAVTAENDVFKANTGKEVEMLTKIQTHLLDVAQNMYSFFIRRETRESPEAALALMKTLQDTMPEFMKTSEMAKRLVDEHIGLHAQARYEAQTSRERIASLEKELDDTKFKVLNLEAYLHEADRPAQLVDASLERVCRAIQASGHLCKSQDVGKLVSTLQDAWRNEAVAVTSDLVARKHHLAILDKEVDALLHNQDLWSQKGTALQQMEAMEREITVQRKVIDAIRQRHDNDLGLQDFIREKYEAATREEVEYARILKEELEKEEPDLAKLVNDHSAPEDLAEQEWETEQLGLERPEAAGDV